MSVPATAFVNLFRECSVTELTELQCALANELVDRLRAERNPPPVTGRDFLDLMRSDNLAPMQRQKMADLLVRDRALPKKRTGRPQLRLVK